MPVFFLKIFATWYGFSKFSCVATRLTANVVPCNIAGLVDAELQLVLIERQPRLLFEDATEMGVAHVQRSGNPFTTFPLT